MSDDQRAGGETREFWIDDLLADDQETQALAPVGRIPPAPSPPSFDVVRRGYDRVQVGEAVDGLLALVDDLRQRLAGAETDVARLRAELEGERQRFAGVADLLRTSLEGEGAGDAADRVAALLEEARRRADAIRAEARADADDRIADADRRVAEADQGVAEAQARAERIVAEAEGVRDEAWAAADEERTRARGEAEEIVARAGAEAARLRAEADEHHRRQAEAAAEAVSDAEAEVVRLRALRDRVVAEVEGLSAALAAVVRTAGGPAAE